MKKTTRIITTMILCCICIKSAEALVHPGCLSTQADLDRMVAKVVANEQPWKGSWDILVGNTGGYLDDAPEAQPIIYVGGGYTENYIRLARDCAKAYQCALRYNISGETAYGDKAVQIMNTWASTMTDWAGDTNVSLRAGLYGYEMACAGELMRDYIGWDPDDFAAFQTWMIDKFYTINTYFLTYHHGTVDSHYWANWELANMASEMAIGVLCDRQDIFDEGLNYFYSGIGNGNINNAVHYIHPDGFGQWQESGRDQGHATMGVPLMGTICEIAWNQGIDLYSYAGNRFLAGCEYIAKYNLWYDVPYVGYVYEYGHPGTDATYYVQTVISSGSRGNVRPGWDMIYNHYVNRLGMTAPYSQEFAEKIRPEGGGFNYGTTSGGFDQLGFTTLTHTLDPISSGSTPSELLPYIQGQQITLSWHGSAYATSYNIKRSTTSGGPYTTIAIMGTKDNYYIDPGLTPVETYYYVVSANNQGGESPNSIQVAATAENQLLTGTVIGTDGSWSSKGATKYLVFDGSLRNFFDGPDSISLAGLDLGSAVTAVITKVKYCPRQYFSSRMVGGKFQGSNTADFSSTVTDLFTISSGPPDGVLTSQTISNPGSFRYVRYLSPSGGYGNVAEIQFLGNVSGLSAPETPADFSADVINSSQVYLHWSASSTATNYYLKRSTTSGGPYTIIAIGNFTGFADTGLIEGRTYYYVVSALNSTGQSADSNEVSATPQTMGPTLVARYKLDGDANDSSGNGHHAITTGSPVYTTGRIGLAIDLDGTDDYLTLPSGLADSDDITIAAWIYWDGGDQWQRIFDFGNNTTQYMFLSPRSGSDTLRFAITTSGNSGEQTLNTTQLATGSWVHIAITLGGNIGKLYVNGVLKNTNSGMTLNPSDFNPTFNYIGDSQWSADPLFDGLIDDFRIYNYALSAADISTLANGAANNPPSFTIDPINNSNAIEDSAYTGQPLTSNAVDLDGDELTFSKISGPDWLNVSIDGSLSGIPSDSDVGDNVFTVRVEDTGGLSDTAGMNIYVYNVYSGVRGMEDLMGFVNRWLNRYCWDVACGGADLDDDWDVDFFDFAKLANNWQIEF